MPIEAYIPFVILGVIIILLALSSVQSKLKRYRLRSPIAKVEPKKKRRHKVATKKKPKGIVIRWQ